MAYPIDVEPQRFLAEHRFESAHGALDKFDVRGCGRANEYGVNRRIVEDLVDRYERHAVQPIAARPRPFVEIGDSDESTLTSTTSVGGHEGVGVNLADATCADQAESERGVLVCVHTPSLPQTHS